VARVGDIVKNAQPAGAVGDSQLLVLASLTLLSELRDLNHEMDTLRSEVAQAKSDRDALNARIADIENTVASAINEAAEKVEAFAQN
jgi:cell division protein ZapA (FtsZ GTPase activity inhibitor)